MAQFALLQGPDKVAVVSEELLQVSGTLLQVAERTVVLASPGAQPKYDRVRASQILNARRPQQPRSPALLGWEPKVP